MRLNTEALVALRKAGGDSQQTLAERAGVSEKSLNLIEQGKTTPRVSTLKKLAEALSVPLGAITAPDQDRQAS